MGWSQKEFEDLCAKTGVKPEDALKAGKLDLTPEHQAANSLAQSKNSKKRYTDERRAKKGYQTKLGTGNLPIAQPKPHSPLALVSQARTEAKGNGGVDRRIVVRITSYRRRFLDFDNFTGGLKSCVDCLVISGLLPDDGPDTIRLEPIQSKVASKKQERTEICIEYPPDP
jgi:hypothetical protein